MHHLDRQQLHDINGGYCTACMKRGFVIGPMALPSKEGVNINIECANLACRARYAVAFFSGAALMGHYIGEGKDGPTWPSEPRN